MKLFHIPFIMGALLLASPVIAAQGNEQAGQIVIPHGSKPSGGVAQKNFTGTVRVDPAFQTTPPARTYGSYVTFEPGARTNWHIHPLGQVLVVTFGKGLTQEWGKPASVIRTGDVVVCPPGVKHWHGAAPGNAMTHLAIGERSESGGAQWLEPVADADYAKAAKGSDVDAFNQGGSAR